MRALRNSAFALIAGILGACSSERLIVPEGPPASPVIVAAAVRCHADVTTSTFECGTTSSALGSSIENALQAVQNSPLMQNVSAPDDVYIGGQGRYLQMIASGVRLSGSSYSVAIAIQNLLGQPLGTPDGSSALPVRLFVHSGPTNGVTITNADGTGTFTAPNQPYYLFDGMIAPGGISENRRAILTIPNGVTQFDVQLFVYGAVQDPSVSPGLSIPTNTFSLMARGGSANTMCAVASSANRTYCWGNDALGQTASGRFHFSLTPVQADVSGASALASTSTQVCALISGRAYCWGSNITSAGSGTTTDVIGRTPSLLNDVPWQSLSMNNGTFCGIVADGRAFCWGNNNNAQVGDSSFVFRGGPTLVKGGLTFSSVSVGTTHACGITTGGALYCWGSNSSGQLGDGSTSTAIRTATVVQGMSSGVTQVSLGSAYTCAIQSGNAYCWGSAVSGNLGDNNTSTHVDSVPTLVQGGLTFASISAGSSTTCGLTTSNLAYCWGANGSGQVGDNTNISRGIPTAVAGGLTFSAIVTSTNNTCAIRTTGAMYCWGANDRGQVGDGTQTARFTPTVVSGGRTYSAVTSGVFGQSFCGLTTSTTVFCWGANEWGQLGKGYLGNASAPRGISLATQFAEIAVGGTHTCARTSATSGANTWCWGTNGSGQLGLGTTGNITNPTQVPTRNFSALSLGNAHSCGISANALTCWGNNTSGQLGQGNTTTMTSPASVSLAGSVLAVAAGSSFTCAIVQQTSPVLFCWGDNSTGALGIGNTTSQNSPTQVTALTSVSAIAAGTGHMCALGTGSSGTGTYCWGTNSSGQVGNGTTSTSPVTSPTLVSTTQSFTSLTAGVNNSCGLTAAGAAYCWGNGTSIGDGTFTSRTVPTAVTGGHTFSSISLTFQRVCGLGSGPEAGTLLCWGAGMIGEFGNAITSTSSQPVVISLP